jgi:putative endonuclease
LIREQAADAPIDLGEWGEGQASDRLRRDGWKILGRRVRPNRRDELDIIAARDGVLAFVEVKTRTDERVARAGASVNAAKRRALNRAARAYLRQAGFPNLIYRFDIVEVVGRPDGAPPEIRCSEDAFPFERMTRR